MPLSGGALSEARETVQDLLEELGLEAYVFEVAPSETNWRVRVDCVAEGGWQSTVLLVAHDQLCMDLNRREEREHVLADWRTRLAACKCS